MFPFIFAVTLGLVFASFIHTTAFRRIQGISLYGRSVCDSCKTKIPIIGLIPVIGYIFYKGKCKFCQHSIWIGYPLFEILNAIILAILVFTKGYNLSFLQSASYIEFGLYIAFLDAFSQSIDSVAIVLGMIMQVAWLYSLSLAILPYIIGLLVGTSFFYWLRYLYSTIRSKEGLGEGDIALFGLFGFFGGINVLLPTAFFAALFALVFTFIWFVFTKQSLQKTLPFAPWLFFGFLLTQIFSFYDSIFPNINILLHSIL